MDEQIPFRIVKEMHRSNPWASDWLKRYDNEGIYGLKDRTKGVVDHLNCRKRSVPNYERTKRTHNMGGRQNRWKS